MRVINVHDLTAFAGDELHRLVGHHDPVVVVTLGHPAAVWGLLGGRISRVEVVGWREPAHPMPQQQLAAHAGLDIAGVSRAVEEALATRPVL